MVEMIHKKNKPKKEYPLGVFIPLDRERHGSKVVLDVQATFKCLQKSV